MDNKTKVIATLENLKPPTLGDKLFDRITQPETINVGDSDHDREVPVPELTPAAKEDIAEHVYGEVMDDIRREHE